MLLYLYFGENYALSETSKTDDAYKGLAWFSLFEAYGSSLACRMGSNIDRDTILGVSSASESDIKSKPVIVWASGGHVFDLCTNVVGQY